MFGDIGSRRVRRRAEEDHQTFRKNVGSSPHPQETTVPLERRLVFKPKKALNR
jgi:hypothetical protein